MKMSEEEKLYCYNIIRRIALSKYRWVNMYGMECDDLINNSMIHLLQCKELFVNNSTRQCILCVACKYAVMNRAADEKRKQIRREYRNSYSFEATDKPRTTIMELSTFLLENDIPDLSSIDIPELKLKRVPSMYKSKHFVKVNNTSVFESMIVEYDLTTKLTEREIVAAREVIYGVLTQMDLANRWRCSRHTVLNVCKIASRKLELILSKGN